jgi:flagellar hook-associated protein 2
MGTVGLSFGSPTSGAGFDVSSTVASIVGNLQKVETPWKTQLTAMKSQDTAISSLGTLLSNLSNDLSQLTDFQGIMTQKTGSSSDNNVLELTAASSAAAAGTHTIVVTNLATTSSGYLAPIANANDALSGSLTIQVGSGKAQTISLPSSGGTLASLAAAINSSAVGVTASVLTDSSGSRLNLVSGTSGTGGVINISSNSIFANPNTLLNYTGSAGTDTQNSTGLLDGIANATDTLSGSISIQVGSGTAQTITLNSTSNSLATLADAINKADIGVTASVVTNSDGTSSLSLLSQTGGSDGTLTVTSNVRDTGTALGYTSPVQGKDAKLTVDGVDLTSSSNTVTNLIPGLTFQLLAPSAKQSDGSLDPVQVVIANDVAAVESTMNTMVSDYNSLIGAVNAQEGNDSSGNPEPLFGTPTLSLLQQQLLGSLNLQNPSGYLDSIKNSTDTLSGSISIQVGSGTAHVVTLDSSHNTLAGMASAINAAGIGVTAKVMTDASGSRLALVSGTAGSTGSLTVSSSINDTTTGKALTYNDGGSDIAGLAGLGISLSANYDGTLTFDATSLTSVLNSDFSGVVGFFQNANSWGQTFTTTLNNAGTSSSKGILSLAENSNSSIESTLNANISKEESMISIQQKSLTAELNSANEILQMLPSQLDGVNQLYSAITGYNQSR